MWIEILTVTLEGFCCCKIIMKIAPNCSLGLCVMKNPEPAEILSDSPASAWAQPAGLTGIPGCFSLEKKERHSPSYNQLVMHQQQFCFLSRQKQLHQSSSIPYFLSWHSSQHLEGTYLLKSVSRKLRNICWPSQQSNYTPALPGAKQDPESLRGRHSLMDGCRILRVL